MGEGPPGGSMDSSVFKLIDLMAGSDGVDITAIDKANRAMAKEPGEITGGERATVAEVFKTGGQVGARLVQRAMGLIEATKNAALGDTEQKYATKMMIKKLLGPIDFANAIVNMAKGQDKSQSLCTCRK